MDNLYNDDEGLVCLTKGQVERLRRLLAEQLEGEALIIKENFGVLNRRWRVHQAEERLIEYRKIYSRLLAFMSRQEIRERKQTTTNK